MIDLNENNKKLDNLVKRLKEMGDSLWHSKPNYRIKESRSKNYGTKFLGWC